MRWHTGIVFCLLIPLAIFGGCSDDNGGPDGPLIEIDISNVKHLCGFGVINATEDRCNDHGECDSQYCWFSDQPHHTDGFCRQCANDGECPGGLECDHNWCHTPCSQTSDCGGEENVFCTAGYCRKAHYEQSTFNFCNAGNRDLEVYISQTKLYGPAQACTFSRWEWVPEGLDTVTLAPDECNLYLNIKFTPPDVGVSRGFIEILSNSIEVNPQGSVVNPLPLLLCGDAVEAICQVAIDDQCPDCASCTAEDFTTMMAERSEPDCSDYN